MARRLTRALRGLDIRECSCYVRTWEVDRRSADDVLAYGDLDGNDRGACSDHPAQDRDAPAVDLSTRLRRFDTTPAIRFVINHREQ